MQVNMDYHALHPGSHQPYLDRLWPQGPGFNPQQLGYYLHYLQDTFSHAGYDNPMYGHGLDYIILTKPPVTWKRRFELHKKFGERSSGTLSN
jgi:hypothetical protein